MKKQNKTLQKTVRRPPKAGRLATEPQPSPEAKKAGWERRRERLKIADTIAKYKDIPLEDILEAQKIIRLSKANGFTKEKIKKLQKLLKIESTMTLQDYQLLQYATDSKLVLDWIDRNLEKAPTRIAGEDGGQFTIIIKKYNED
jgi:DNA-binding transcriptional MerR regulator